MPSTETRAPVTAGPTQSPIAHTQVAAPAGDLQLAGDGVLARVNSERNLISFTRPAVEVESFRLVNRVAIESRAVQSEGALEPAIVFAGFKMTGRADGAGAADVQPTLRSAAFSEQLDQLRGRLQEQFELDKTISVSVAGVSLGFSLLYVLWLIRGGVLMGSYLSALPAWRVLDPLPVLSRVDEEIEEDEDVLDADARSGGDSLRGFG